MKIFNSQTEETLNLSEHELKCYVFMLTLQEEANYLPGWLAYKCGILSGECSKIISTVYTPDELCAAGDKKYIENILEILTEILDTEMTKESLKQMLEDCRDEFLNRDYIHVIEYNEL